MCKQFFYSRIIKHRCLMSSSSSSSPEITNSMVPSAIGLPLFNHQLNRLTTKCSHASATSWTVDDIDKCKIITNRIIFFKWKKPILLCSRFVKRTNSLLCKSTSCEWILSPPSVPTIRPEGINRKWKEMKRNARSSAFHDCIVPCLLLITCLGDVLVYIKNK